jgi:hypothetical protein
MTPFKCSQEGSSVGRRVQVLAGGFKCWQEGSSVVRRVQVLAELKRIPGFEP